MSVEVYNKYLSNYNQNKHEFIIFNSWAHAAIKYMLRIWTKKNKCILYISGQKSDKWSDWSL